MTRGRLRTASTLAIAVILVVIVLATLTPLGEGAADAAGDRCALGVPCALGHFAVFVLLGVAMAVRYAASDAARRSPRRVLLMMALAVWVLAGADELAQDWVGRETDINDWLADVLGAVTGVALGSVALRFAVRAFGIRL